MHHVGCVFGVNDLTWDQWQGLIWLAHERTWMDREADAVTKRVKDMETGKPFTKAEEDVFAEGRKAFAQALK